MAGFTRINMVLFLMLELQFTAVAGQGFYLSVREGHDVTLPCESLRNAQSGCEETGWVFYRPRVAASEDLVRNGQIERREISPSKSNRLSVTEKCSLVVKKVTSEDVGQYTCRQSDKSGRQYKDSQVYLSVVIMTEQKDGDKVTLNCYVSTFSCRHKVKWLYQGQDVDKNTNLQTSQSGCQATLSFLDSHFISPSRYKLLTCEVTNDVGRKVEFSFRHQTSGDDKTPATTKPTRITEKTTTGTGAGPDPPDWSLWGAIAGTLSLAVLIITVVLVKRSKRRKGKKTQLDGNTGLSLNPAETRSGPEPSQDTADPEEGVSYASISYTKKPGGKAQVQNKDEDDAVTYSTVKVSSSSTGASAEASDLYATITKPDQ